VRKIFYSLGSALIFASFAMGCSGLRSPTPGNWAPDDLVTTPGGPAYMANVQQQDEKNRWSPIQTSEVTLNGINHVTYRANIETEAAQTRNNIVYIRTPGQNITDVELNASKVPTGMKIKNGMHWNGPLGTVAQVLQIELSKDIKAGQYSFEIDIGLNGTYQGQIPCTIKVNY
jgi:hypothetical protein